MHPDPSGVNKVLLKGHLTIDSFYTFSSESVIRI